ncbi:hypothetical protein V6Z11_A06G173200 [Gossypium hirsutum]
MAIGNRTGPRSSVEPPSSGSHAPTSHRRLCHVRRSEFEKVSLFTANREASEDPVTRGWHADYGAR